MELLEAIFEHVDATALTAWATVVLTFATIVLALLTGWLALEQRKTRRDAFAPDVVVTIEPAYITVLQVCIQNIGRGPAKNVRVTSTPPLIYQMDKEPEFDLTTTKSLNPSFLRPGQKIARWLGYFMYFSNKTYEIKVQFNDTLGRAFEHHYTIEVEMYDRAQFQKDQVAEVAKHTEALVKAVGNLGSNWHRLHVDTYNSEDRDAEEAAREQSIGDSQRNSGGQ